MVIAVLVLSSILACNFGGGAGTATPLVTVESPGTPTPRVSRETPGTPTPQLTPASPAAAKPRVNLDSPDSRVELQVGQQLQIVCTVEDPQGVVSVELAVDGGLYATQENPNPEGEPRWKFIETWTATVDPGIHTLTITAYNVDKMPSDPVTISVTVVEGPAAEAPTATTAAALPTDTPVVPQQALPDLVVAEFQVDPASVAYGGSAEATFTIRNAGTAPAGDCHVMYIWAPSGSVRGCDRYTGPLSAGAEITLSCTAGPLYASYETHILVDTGGVVAESNEDNNWAGFMVSAATAALPDLTIEDLYLGPPNPGSGGYATANIVIANHGSGDAGSFTLYYWWAESERCDLRMDPLPAGDEVTVSCHVGPFSHSFNTYAMADVLSEVAETTDDNNRRDLYIDAG